MTDLNTTDQTDTTDQDNAEQAVPELPESEIDTAEQTDQTNTETPKPQTSAGNNTSAKPAKLPAPVLKAAAAWGNALVKADQGALSIAKRLADAESKLRGEKAEILNRSDIADALSSASGRTVSPSRVSQYRTTGQAYLLGLSDDALLVINRGTGKGAGRIDAGVLSEILDALQNEAIDLAEANAAVLRGWFQTDPGAEVDDDSSEGSSESSEDSDDETEDMPNWESKIDKAVTALVKAMKDAGDELSRKDAARFVAAVVREYVPADGRADFTKTLIPFIGKR